MKYSIVLITIIAACGSTTPQTSSQGNVPANQPATNQGLTYMGTCTQYFQTDVMSRQTWSSGNPAVVQQGICTGGGR